MTKTSLEDMTTKQLVDYFRDIGVEKSKSLLYDQVDKYNRLFEDMKLVNKELKRRSKQSELLRLYDYPNVQVQLEAARYTAIVAPTAARNKVEAIANSKDFPQAGDAGMTLWSWDTYGISDR